MIRLRYGNTNTFYINGLLIDTDYAGTMHAFYREMKSNGLKLTDIKYIMATHYHPDHMGLTGELVQNGVKLLLMDVQLAYVSFSDKIFARDGLHFTPIDAEKATVISCDESRRFLSDIGISGEIIHTPSHSADSISLCMDNGDCFTGDLEPYDYIEAYADNALLKRDWDSILSRPPERKHIFFAHIPDRIVQ